tara:strand:- start:1331 stop:2458 length:1128 start_codon:yes stop_codon:yes gene_type:complete
MAITRLKDIVTVFQDKWTYGDSRFGYESEINETHNTVYPAMIIQPPESIMPDIYSGREEFEFEVNFYNLYQQAAQSAVTLQHRWDNLQDLATEWMDLVLKNFQDATVQVYLNDESIEFERVKEVANDRLVQIKLIFTMSAFTKCFRPVSNYPSDFSDLVVWLRADSGVTFDIATQQVSAWTDYSGNSNSVAQATSASQPLRIGYDGANDKARINFTANQHFVSNNNLPISSTSFSMFFVAKGTQGGLFDFANGSKQILLGSFSNTNVSFFVQDAAGQSEEVSGTISDSSPFNIIFVKFHNKRATIEINNTFSDSLQNPSFDNTTVFNDAVFRIGKPNSGTGFAGDLQEVIIYNKQIEDSEKNIVKDYLNNKYRIY